jgi:hypothetical protein
VNSVFGTAYTRVCNYRFADLRHSGNLSLIVSIDAGGTSGCNSSDIFDKTSSGFEYYSSWAYFSSDSDVQDVNHDGKLELILWGPITWQSDLGMECDWPMIFTWNGEGYAEVSDQYKGYYKAYLKDLDEQIAAVSSRMPVAQSTMIPMQLPVAGGRGVPDGQSTRTLVKVPVAAASSEAEANPDSDLVCERTQVAKTEQFLGISSDTTMSAAIKDSESQDPDRRILAAIVLSFVESPEAKADLKTLANDSDPDVAKTAKDRLSQGTEPGDHYREVDGSSVQWHAPIQ